MARKRMLSEEIICSDAFMEMSCSARMLYVYLNAGADDDGFIGAPKGIIRKSESTLLDLEEIMRHRFAYMFPSGVVVLKHWRINNYLRSDRYVPTTYREERDLLLTKENGAYSLRDIDEDAQISMSGTVGIPSDNQSETEGEHRLDKIRLDKSRVEENREACSEEPAPPAPPSDAPSEPPKRKRTPRPKGDEPDPFVVFASKDAELLKALEDFEEMRNTVKKPLTYRAKTDLIGDLNRMSESRDVWIESLSRSIKKCWLGVFFPKKDEDEEARKEDKAKAERRKQSLKEAEELERRIEAEKDERSALVDSVKEIYRVPVFKPKGIDD